MHCILVINTITFNQHNSTQPSFGNSVLSTHNWEWCHSFDRLVQLLLSFVEEDAQISFSRMCWVDSHSPYRIEGLNARPPPMLGTNRWSRWNRIVYSKATILTRCTSQKRIWCARIPRLQFEDVLKMPRAILGYPPVGQSLLISTCPLTYIPSVASVPFIDAVGHL